MLIVLKLWIKAVNLYYKTSGRHFFASAHYYIVLIGIY